MSLLETVKLSAPTTTSVDAAEFRSALVAIATLVENQEKKALGRSLQDWWQWLDDEGYDRPTVATLVRQVTAATIGNNELLTLESLIRDHWTAPQGLPNLIQLLQEQYPNLAQKLDNLEGLARIEEHEMHQRAGGRLTGGQIAMVTTATVLGTAMTAGVGIYGVKKIKQFSAWIQEKREKTSADIQEKERAAEEEKLNLDRKAEEAKAQGVDNVESSLDSAIKNPAERSAKLNERLDIAAKAARNEAIYEPIKPVDLGISLSEYTDNEIDIHAKALVEKHAEAFADTWVKSEIEPRIAKDIKASDNYERKLEHEVEKARKDPLNGAFEDDLKAIVSREVNESDWFKDEIRKILLEGDLNQYEVAAKKELEGHYKRLIKAEVETAKREALEEAKSEFYNEITEGKGLVKKSEVTVDRDVASGVNKMENTVEDVTRTGNSIVDDL